MNSLHPIQMQILTILTVKKFESFSKLNLSRISNDHFSYHLKKLIELGLIEKSKEDKYQLTFTGKSLVTNIDIASSKIESQPKTLVLAICQRYKNGIKEFLFQERTKHPFYGITGFPGGKIKFGETLVDSVKRELIEETGLFGNPFLFEIKHTLKRFSPESSIIKDDIIYCFRFDNPQGELKDSVEGKNIWLNKEDFANRKYKFADDLNTLKNIDSSSINFSESTVIIENL